MTSNLKRWIENGAPDVGELEAEAILYAETGKVISEQRREEDKLMYKFNAIVLSQLYQTELLFG